MTLTTFPLRPGGELPRRGVQVGLFRRRGRRMAVHTRRRTRPILHFSIYQIPHRQHPLKSSSTRETSSDSCSGIKTGFNRDSTDIRDGLPQTLHDSTDRIFTSSAPSESQEDTTPDLNFYPSCSDLSSRLGVNGRSQKF